MTITDELRDVWGILVTWAVRASIAFGILTLFPGLSFVLLDCVLYIYRAVVAILFPETDATAAVLQQNGNDIEDRGGGGRETAAIAIGADARRKAVGQAEEEGAILDDREHGAEEAAYADRAAA